MRKMVVMALVLCLLTCLPAFALDVEAVPDRLLQVTQDFMKQENYKYEVREDRKHIIADFTLSNTLKSCDVVISAFDDMLRVSAYAPEDVPPAQRDQVAKLLVLINYDVSYATFHMDYEDGEVSCVAFQYVESVLPGVDEVRVMVHQALIYMDDFGDAIDQVAKGKLDAQQAFDQAMEKRR